MHLHYNFLRLAAGRRRLYSAILTMEYTMTWVHERPEFITSLPAKSSSRRILAQPFVEIDPADAVEAPLGTDGHPRRCGGA